MNEPRQIPSEDLALYAMQALPTEDMAAIAAALHDNPEAQQELARVQGDLILLALSAEQHSAPAGAFDRLLSRIHESSPSLEFMTASTYKATPVPRHSRWAIFTPWAIAAVLAIVCSILGYRVSSLNDALDGESRLVSNLAAKASRAQQVLEVLNAPDAQRVTLTAAKTPPSPTAHTVYLADRGALLMEASHLQPTPPGKTYELWVIPANGAPPIPAGTFWPNSDGYASVVLPKLPSGIPAKAFGITIENNGGSATPTAPIILSGE
jgi:anti-sigma-K factor RskA